MSDEPRVKAGEGWELRCGDALELLASLPAGSVDAVVSDPPFANTDLSWDTPVDWPAWWRAVERVRKPRAAVVLFACGRFTDELIATKPSWRRYKLVWVKDRAAGGFLSAKRRPLRAFEEIVVFGDTEPAYFPQMEQADSYRAKALTGSCMQHYAGASGVEERVNAGRYPTDVLKFTMCRDDGAWHPTQKPESLMVHLVSSFAPPGGLVVDPFAGSGTTGVACIRAGRRFIGSERDPGFFKKAAARIAMAGPDLHTHTHTHTQMQHRAGPGLFGVEGGAEEE